MWQKTFLILISFILLPAIPVNSYHPIHNSLTFKISIETKDSQTEWIYHYPNEFRKRVNGEDTIGTKAEQEILGLFQDLAVHKTDRSDEMVKIMKNKGFHSIERLEIVWKPRGKPLKTWIWEETNES
jgi:hypothetical protein